MKDDVVFLPVKFIFKYVQKRDKWRASTEIVGWNEWQLAVRQKSACNSNRGAYEVQNQLSAS